MGHSNKPNLQVTLQLNAATWRAAFSWQNYAAKPETHENS